MPSRFLLSLALLAAVLAALTIPAWQVRRADPASLARFGLDRVSSAAAAALAAVGGLYSLMLGAAIGSFLGVVADRLPRGVSLIWPPSRCDACGTAIRARDNLPVLGWLWLGGRCRSCAAAIPIRLPLVELGTGLLFLAIFAAELLSQGQNLPGGRPAPFSLASLGGLAALHALLVGWLMALGLIEQRRSRLPGRFWVVGALLGLAPVVWPRLHPLAWDGSAPTSSSWATPFGAALTALAGAALGAWLAYPLGRRTGAPSRSDATVQPLAGALAVAGAVLGWQAVLVVAAGLLVVRLILPIPWRGWLALGVAPLVVGQIAAWRWTAPLPEGAAVVRILAVQVTAIAAISLLGWVPARKALPKASRRV